MEFVTNYSMVMALVSALVSDRNGLTQSSAWKDDSDKSGTQSDKPIIKIMALKS